MVKQVRGPFLSLPPHARSCGTPEELPRLAQGIRRASPGKRLAADLFSGAGGLSLGLHDAGFEVIFAVDHYAEAVETHRHHFPGLTVDWDLSDPATVERVGHLIRDAGIDLVAGGPPCQPFSKAGRSKIRHSVHNGLRDPHDERRDLWRSFLEIVRISMPAAVLMENVPDMALDKEMFILRTMVEELEGLGYSVEERVVDTWRYGVPQFRQRLVLVAVRDALHFEWPHEAEQRVTVDNAIGELPEVEGGWRPEGGAAGFIEYPGPKTTFQKRMRRGVVQAEEHKLFDHITRPVREDDAAAFELMDATTKYSDLPQEVKRYRDDIFTDKYKRLDAHDVSRTITAHIAKDGYWYIHPTQGRTITVREAARLQTFPDWYRFAGGPSAAFKQIGNAVPPLLAEHLGKGILSALEDSRPSAFDSRAVAEALGDWYKTREALAMPWLRATTRWQAVAGELLLDRADAQQVRLLWPVLQLWITPGSALEHSEPLRHIGKVMGREARVETLLEMASWLVKHPGALDAPEIDHASIPGLTESTSDLAVLAVPTAGEDDSDEPVIVGKGVLRPAGRFAGEPVTNRRMTDGRLAVARMVGGGNSFRDAHLGLIELANSLCRPSEPLCAECPLAHMCAESEAEEQRAAQLF